jgi:hypothetical protein
VGPGSEIYPAEGSWAEPDLDHAAKLMRHVWQHPDEALKKAERASLDIRSRYSPQVTGRLARERLEHLLQRRTGSVPRPAVAPIPPSDPIPGLAAIDRELSVFDLRLGASPLPHGVKGLFRRLVLRMILPFTHHERNLDRAIAHAIRVLRVDLDREQALGLQDRARLSRLEARLQTEEKE